jgi:hypothetical protein
MKHTFSVLSLTLSLLAAAALPAQGMPQPGPEHQKLAAHAGTWDCAVEMLGEDGKMQTSKGVNEARVACGGLWLVEDFQAEMMGAPFTGHGVSGFDPAKGKYTTTWVDSMVTAPITFEGTFDAAGKVLTMTGMVPGMDGKPQQHRHVITWKDANQYTFEMFVAGPDGKEMCVLKITYTRRAKGEGKAEKK